MRALLLGALLGLLIVFPALLAPVVGIVGAAISQPVVVAFVAGLTAPRWMPKLTRRWTP
ncbi:MULTISPECIES: hypothetical protein [unclassified Streptomyces]|uniref:hypothetical protein n=1 Tax=unclassified Streptomyces TaxID=2593676 RepID=UPI002E2B1B7B|nr:hypothetical protein [Streptomyces sp. NBC_00228]